MWRSRNILSGLALAAALSSAPAVADTFALVPQAGLAGYGATVQWGFNQYLAVSAGYTFMDQSVRNVETDDGTYDGDIRLSNPQVMLNWAPFGGHFRVSAGVIYQDTDFALRASNLSGNAGNVVTSMTVSGDFVKSIAPALTVGWETPIDKPGLGYHFSAGAMYSGAADVQVSARCRTANSSGVPTLPEQAACDTFTASERKKIEDDLERYEILPILQAGLIFRM
ncbi:hypothetical protein [Perlucidibaca piscinae]|uniref:hypothetical protein n=1 Tax=Perlucidibaca piscinae TaxID=392589 RepID=UPI0003B675E7|nr:hypothetical protein [Perlucidibaca piscinae]